MPLSSPNFIVQPGLYYDYGQPLGQRWQFLVSSDTASALMVFLGIATTIGASRLFHIALKFRDRFRNIDSEEAKEAPTSAEGRGWTNLKYGIKETFSGANSLNGPRPLLRWWHNFRTTGWKPLLSGLGCAILFILLQFAGIVTSQLQDGALVLASSPDCGFYSRQIREIFDLYDGDLLYGSAIQEESAKIARNCQGTSLKSPECSFFLNMALDISLSNSSCPFGPGLCLDGVQSFRMTTNAVSARSLGINAPNTIEFNRTTVCSPLNINETYVRVIEQTSPFNTTWGYYYGPFYF